MSYPFNGQPAAVDIFILKSKNVELLPFGMNCFGLGKALNSDFSFTMDKDDPKEHITRLKISRGRIKASLTRLENTAEDLMLKNEILIRLQRWEELIKEFEKLDAELSVEDSEIV
ncbi:hypothetical protein AVEN_232623-1 [Araneus ventricosus]|uniref:Uncharacterized protein n=1 Tax=Araneus ventricosus TaxID=182803 RepID=A0A4Y2QSN7_ARAVE|nr:hypothetical protein AVEN_232623-1 [Araneus ventricosus]